MTQLQKFLFGSITGVAFGVSANEKVFDSFYRLVGYDRDLSRDYLYNPRSNLSLEQRREVFTQTLREKGASIRLHYMITDVNYKILENNATQASPNKSEIEVLEQGFREYYPELFDEKPAQGFITSLNLKTRCNDHGIPSMLPSKN